MSKALALMFSETGADLVGGRTLASGDWLRTVVFTSLFTDARADAPIDGEQGGYWGDSFHSRSLGSLLWTLRREKLNNATLLRARDICLQALAWLVGKYIRAVSVDIARLARDRIGIQVTVTRSNGATETFNAEFSTDVV